MKNVNYYKFVFVCVNVFMNKIEYVILRESVYFEYLKTGIDLIKKNLNKYKNLGNNQLKL